jgi:peptide/nickel transport system ATP-binding protein
MSGLAITDLRLEVSSSGADIVDEVTLSVPPGQVMGLVGESGSGKTTVGLAVLGHARRGVRIAGGSVRIGEVEIFGLSPERQRAMRGKVVSYVPQDPASALNPALRIGTQLVEVLESHDFGRDTNERTARVSEMMREVALPDDPAYLRRYPHQLSGGQQQRIGLAMAFACRPSVIVLDEPTTGLDVSTQAHVLETIRNLALMHRVAALYVTHDLAVVSSIADRIAVMYAGRVVEEGPTERLFADSGHPYTRHLIAAIPHLDGRKQLVGLAGGAPSPGRRPQGCFFTRRCELAIDQCAIAFPPAIEVEPGHFSRCYRAGVVHGLGMKLAAAAQADEGVRGQPVLEVRDLSVSYSGHQVVHDISFVLNKHESLAVVGESGSGKTTLARSIAGLHAERSGDVLLDGKALASASRARTAEDRRRVQYVFQNPYGSLNPRRTVGDSLRRPLMILGLDRGEGRKRVDEMLDRVSLPAIYAERFPDQLSGGERQRVAIARALVSEPDVLVCDEVTSALDVLVQAAVVELLARLQRELGLSMVFVTHNLPLVRSIAHRVVVLKDGRIVEQGEVDEILSTPQDSYTKRLLEDTPQL